MLPILKVRVLPAVTRLLNMEVKKKTDPVTIGVTAVLIDADALVMVSDADVGVYPLKVSWSDPPAGI